MEKKNLLSKDILRFYKTIQLNFPLPGGVSVLYPYGDREVWNVVRAFYEKYYADSRPRVILFGINPGRFGAGITGVPFTDPIRLEAVCGITNPFQKRQELSSEFIYNVVDAWGGETDFYRHFFVSALSPLGFVSGGKNLNYYDDRTLLTAATPYILENIRYQKNMVGSPETCFCLGEGANYKHFCKMNASHGFFSEIVPLPHPRWVMQYRRKRVNEYVRLYVDKLRASVNGT